MFAVFVSWIISAFIFIAFGKLIARILNFHKQSTYYNICDIFFMGLCFVGVILSVFSLFIPLNGSGLLMLMLAVSAGYLVFELAKGKPSALFTKWTELSPLNQILIASGVIVLLCLTLLPPLIYDTGLYHLQAMMWSETYPAVPGLANIHGRFGFNSNSLLLYSVFSFKDIFTSRVFGLQSLSFIVLLCWIVYKIGQSESVITKIALVLSVAVFFVCYESFISSPSTDLLPNILVIYLLLRAVLDKDAVSRSPLLFWVVPIFCLTLKLSVAPICIFCIILLVQLFREKRYKILAVMLIVGLFIFIPWCIRNIIITGYLIYPFPAIDIFSFDWKVPAAWVEGEKAWVTSWARMPGVPYDEVFEMPFWVWGKMWFMRHFWFLKSNLAVMCLAAISPLIVFLSFRKKGIKKISDIYAWLIALCGALFWFVMGPDDRFGFGFIVVAAFAPYMYLNIDTKKVFLRKIPEVLLLAFFVFYAVKGFDLIKSYKGDYTYGEFLYRPQSINYIKQQASYNYIPHRLSDIVIYTPQSAERCFDHELPCAPGYPNELEMRGESIRQGFRVKK